MNAVGLSAGAIEAIVAIVGCLFIYTLIANIASWQFGVYSVTAFAAKDGFFPKSWRKLNKDGVPYMVSIWTSVVAAVLAVAGIIIAYCFPEAEELTNMFWAFFDLSLVCLLLGYIPMFFAFLKLHKKGIKDKNGYWISGSSLKIAFFGIAPVVMLVLSLFFTLIPEFSLEAIADNKILIISSVVCVAIGEFIVYRVACLDAEKSAQRKVARRASRR